MKVTIQAYASLGDILQTRKIEVLTQARTVEELIDQLSCTYGSVFKEKLINPETKELRRFYKILINGQDVDSLNKLKTPIYEGDILLFFPPIAGG